MRKLALGAASALATVAIPAFALTFAAPAQAAYTFPNCDVTLVSTPGGAPATACAGYYSGNLINGSASDIAQQQGALNTIGFNWDGDWGALDPEWKVESLANGNQISFGSTLYGVNFIGAHFGNVAGAPRGGGAGNVSVFWRFDFGTSGANYVTLNDTRGFSNAVLYTPPGIPEPATWAMMLLGFGAVGSTFRRRKAKLAVTYA